MRSLIALALLQASCATLVSGSRQEVQVRTEPPDAELWVDDSGKPAHPGTLELATDRAHQLKVRKAGYREATVTLQSTMNRWVFGNLIFLPFFWVGVLIDAADGAVSKLDRDELLVRLVPLRDPGRLEASVQLPQDALPLQPAAPPPEHPRTLASGTQRTWVVAVMDVTASGKAPSNTETLLALSDQLRVYLAERRVRVVDRGAQEAALRGILQEEQAKSYASCVDDSCQVPLGKALAASHILRSSVARFGATCTTNGELIDLKAEVTVAAASARSDCSDERLLDASERLAEELLKGAR